MPRLSEREAEERDHARLAINEAVRRRDEALRQLEDAIAVGVDAGLSWRELADMTEIDRRQLADKWEHRRK